MQTPNLVVTASGKHKYAANDCADVWNLFKVSGGSAIEAVLPLRSGVGLGTKIGTGSRSHPDATTDATVPPSGDTPPVGIDDVLF